MDLAQEDLRPGGPGAEKGAQQAAQGRGLRVPRCTQPAQVTAVVREQLLGHAAQAGRSALVVAAVAGATQRGDALAVRRGAHVRRGW